MRIPNSHNLSEDSLIPIFLHLLAQGCLRSQPNVLGESHSKPLCKRILPPQAHNTIIQVVYLEYAQHATYLPKCEKRHAATYHRKRQHQDHVVSKNHSSVLPPVVSVYGRTN